MTALPRKKLNKAETAERLGVSVRTLERWGRAGFGPKPQRHGPRLIRYDEDEVQNYLHQGEPARESA